MLSDHTTPTDDATGRIEDATNAIQHAATTPTGRTAAPAGDAARQACEYCDADTSRLYGLPDSAVRPHQTARVACYFCFLRLTGLRPKRRQLVT
jgi:hypothetical protein